MNIWKKTKIRITYDIYETEHTDKSFQVANRTEM